MRSVSLFLMSVLVAAVLSVPAMAAHVSPSFRPSSVYDADWCRAEAAHGVDVMENDAVSAGFEVRLLGQSDVGAMRGMLGVFASAFEEPKTYLDAQPSDAYLAKLLGREHFIAVAAIIDGAIIGGIAAYQLDKFEQDRREIYIYDLAVDEAHRRRGIATAMINALRDEAVRRDAYVIFVQADLIDGPAIALYESLGTKETAHHFDIAPRR